MDPDERMELVQRNTAETITDEELEDIVRKDSPRAYIGYAPTGMMHIGHFTTVRKIADFVEAGFDFTFLIADIHAELDVEKTPLELVEARTEYYEQAIRGMLDAAGIDHDEVDFVRGSDYQHDEEYQKGYMHILENVTVQRAKRSVNEVVRHGDSMRASGLLYSAMQIMDCAALNVDVAYAGRDQRRIYMMGREVLPDIGEDKPTCVFAPLLSGLSGGKMSASDASSKISIHDDEDEVADKINDAYCPAGEVEDNGVLEYAKYLVFPILEADGRDFVVERPEEYGGDLSYGSYEALEQDFVEEELHPQDLKNAVAAEISRVLQPVQERFDGREELLETAYPEEYGG
ncbi:MAG: tyrosine--tRNA ligase [Candidatus Nanohaloarchaea archaeon]|nr:tyrosine--tRNA ligase [Candidatus Nanohaloarchaea archaeon]